MSRYELAMEWVSRAKDRLLSMREEPLEIAEKSGHQDIVTKCDREIERYLRKKILEAFPNDRIVGEEFSIDRGAEAAKQGEDFEERAAGREGDSEEKTAKRRGGRKTELQEHKAEAVWYLDPIDGTTNFVNQRRNYAISVGCAVNGQMSFGIVLDVEGDRCYSAQSGRGAWMNGSRLRASCVKESRNMLLTCPCVTDLFLGDHEKKEAFARLARDVRGVRSLGSVALELCQVASGRADLCIAIKSSPWDHNGARLILREAGGDIRGLDGRPLPYDQDSPFLAGNSEAAVEEIFRQYFL